MFGLDPLSRPVAIAEMLLLLAFAALVGWLLGRLVLNGRVRALRVAIASKQAELDHCRQSKTTRSGVTRSGVTRSGDSINLPVVPASAVPRAEPVTEPPIVHVPADPLLPSLSPDDSPGLTEGPVDLPNPIAANAPPTNRPTVGRADDLMPGNSEAAVLNRIAARSNEINFDRIGRATAAEADDLKDIVGVGPFLERKLHSLGIYTFRQVANFTREDADKVNNLIEFFPGRIERDNWVEQARAFRERKYGNPKSHD